MLATSSDRPKPLRMTQLLTNQGDYIGSTSRSPSFVVVKMKTKANAGDLQSSIFNMLQCGPTQQATLSDL